MKTSAISIGILFAAIGLFVAPNPVPGQQPSGDELRRVEPVRPLHGSKGSHEVDVAASRADAHAKANGQQSTDVDVKNKLTQKQAAIGIGIGGNSSVDLKNKNTNINTLKTGDVVNLNANENKQIQSFGVPFVRALTPR
jgi:hypothetical protein